MAAAYPWPVVLLPGVILPAGLAYGALLAELGDDVDARAKDLEMYAGQTVPPPGYGLETEVEGIRRVADEAGFKTFHLVGYSAGGASVAGLRVPIILSEYGASPSSSRPGPGAAARPPEEAAVFDRFRAIPHLPPDEVMPAFVRTQLAADGVAPPPSPPGPPPPWMPSRLLGIGGFLPRFDAFEPDCRCVPQGSTGRSTSPWVAGQTRTSTRGWRSASRSSSLTSRSRSIAERHHFDPPQARPPCATSGP